jgi:hypothetical protein
MTRKRTFVTDARQGNNLVTKQIEVAEMIYEMDKRQLLRLWSVLSSFGEIRENQRSDNSIRNPQKGSASLDRLCLRPETGARGSNQCYPTRRRSQPNGDVRGLVGTGEPDNGRFRCPLRSEASLSSLFQLSGGRLRDIT